MARNKKTRTGRRILLAVLLAAIVVASPVASASAARPNAADVSAVASAWRKVELALFFGPTGNVCSSMTAHGKKAFARGYLNCWIAAHVRAVTNHLCTLIGGFTGSDWRTKVIFDTGHLGFRFLSPTKVRTYDPLGGNQVLVKSGGKWLFDRGWPSSGC
jgi:hypothetical protein